MSAKQQLKDSPIMPHKTYEFPMSRSYVRHWGVCEGVREILQNALDSESLFEYKFIDDKLFVFSLRSRLDTASLLLGNTSKADSEDTIGSFGEGYKLALLVLARAGKNPIVWNCDVKWAAGFQHSELYGAEIFTITETPLNSPTDGAAEGLTFEIGNLTTEEKQQIIGLCLPMQHKMHVGEVLETSYGNILTERRGKLYVGGLFVCDTELEFSYDVKPQHIKLERDRQTIDSFELRWLTKNMWFAANVPERVALLMERGSPDLEYAAHNAPEIVKEACYNLFKKQYPKAVLAKNAEELERLVKQGMEVKVYSSAFYGAVTSSSGYSPTKTKVEVALKSKSPTEQLQDYFDKNKKYMRTPAIVGMKELIERSKRNWK